MKRVLVGVGAIAIAGAVVLLACDGNDGANGATGAAGPAGTAGQNGANGQNGAAGANGTAGQNGTPGANGGPGANGEAGAPGGTVILSVRAKHGLDISPVPVTTANLPAAKIEQIGLGSYIVNAIADCGGCHDSPDAQPKFLAGGNVFPVDGAGHTVTARNLTPDPTTGLKLSEADFVEVFRTGKDFRATADAGTPVALQFMPWETFRWMSIDDIKAVYAYLTAIQPQTNASIAPDNKVASAPVAYDPTTYTDGDKNRPLPPEVDGQMQPVPDPDSILRGLAITPLDAVPVPAGAGATGLFGRGSYLVNAIGDCSGCHTNPARANGKVNYAQFLGGGQVFPTPPPLQPIFRTTRAMSASLTGTTGGFFNGSGVTFATFVTAITQGVHADDPPPQPPLAFPMPWRVFRNMLLDDLEAVYTYVDAVAAYGRPDKPVQEAARYCTASTDCDQANGETCDTTAKECVTRTCAATPDCPVCQTCTASGNTKCALLSGGALGACIGLGL